MFGKNNHRETGEEIEAEIFSVYESIIKKIDYFELLKENKGIDVNLLLKKISSVDKNERRVKLTEDYLINCEEEGIIRMQAYRDYLNQLNRANQDLTKAIGELEKELSK